MITSGLRSVATFASSAMSARRDNPISVASSHTIALSAPSVIASCAMAVAFSPKTAAVTVPPLASFCASPRHS